MKFYQNLNDCLFFEPYPSDINNLSNTVILELYHGCVCVCVRLYGSIFLSSTIEILLGLQYIQDYDGGHAKPNMGGDQPDPT